jgi:hypothetical protein
MNAYSLKLGTMALWLAFSETVLAQLPPNTAPGNGIDKPAFRPTSEATANSRSPSIRRPGSDTADLPDSPYAVPPGVIYVETALTYQRSKSPAAHEYFTPTLVRVGLLQNWELRVGGPGLIVRDGLPDSTTGFGPITIGAKWHWWEEIEDRGIPAAGLIFQVTTRTGSDAFRPEIAEPAGFLCFSHSLPWEMEFEWNVGLALTRGQSERTQLEGWLLWALSRQVTPNLNVFMHGYIVTPGFVSETEIVLGPGLIWFISERMALDTSSVFGVTDNAPTIARVGLNLAF